MRPAVQQPRWIPNKPFFAGSYRIVKSIACTQSLSPPQMRYLEALEHPATHFWLRSRSEVRHTQRMRTQSAEFQFVFSIKNLFDNFDTIMLGLSYRFSPKKVNQNETRGMHRLAGAPRAPSCRQLARSTPPTARSGGRWPLIDWSICFPALGMSEKSLASIPMVYQHFPPTSN